MMNVAYADDVTTRLNRIERDIDTLNQAVYKGKVPEAVSSSSSGGAYQANVEVRLSDMERQIRDLTGKVEQQTFDVNQMKDRMDRLMADIELRLSSGGQISQPMGSQIGATIDATSSSNVNTQSGTLGASDMGGPVLTGAASSDTDYDAPAPQDSPTQQNLGTLTQAPGGASIPQAGNDPAGQYEMAFSLLKSGNYAASRNGFDEFLKQYPDHPLSPNAMYWLGENYYAEGQYDKATRVFAESYKKYPKGPKTADSLLKLGMSLGKSGKTQQACITLKQLGKEFPSGNASLLRTASQEMTKLGCGE
jgi:tol-pal system protein YbgF